MCCRQRHRQRYGWRYSSGQPSRMQICSRWKPRTSAVRATPLSATFCRCCGNTHVRQLVSKHPCAVPHLTGLSVPVLDKRGSCFCRSSASRSVRKAIVQQAHCQRHSTLSKWGARWSTRHALSTMVAVWSHLSKCGTSVARVWIVGQSCCSCSAAANHCDA